MTRAEALQAIAGGGLAIFAGVYGLVRDSGNGAVAQSDGPGPMIDELVIENFDFIPAAFTARAGTRLRVRNVDSAPHTFTAGDSPSQSGEFGSGDIQQGETVTVSMPSPGTYPYFCVFHPTMQGTLTVVAQP